MPRRTHSKARRFCGTCRKHFALDHRSFRCLNPEQPDYHFREYATLCVRCEGKPAPDVLNALHELAPAPRPVRNRRADAMDLKAEQVWAKFEDPYYYDRHRFSHTIWQDITRLI